VWENVLGGLTFEVGAGTERCFVKWTPRASGVDLEAEAARLAWACTFTSVPRVLDHGTNGDGSWIVTSPLVGESAVAPRWKAEPITAVTALGESLRALHDALPLDTCPFSWSRDERVCEARRRATAGLLDPSAWHEVHHPLTVEQAFQLLADAPPVDKAVVCHGDACAPNTVLDDDGRCSGHVDLGALGVADRWADLAVATWSTTWNYGPGFEDLLLAAYGIGPDPARTRYYRLLWDLGP
jgi:kanamycin kinase